MSRDNDDSTESSLLEQLRQENPQAWERLVVLWGPLVYARCRRRGLSAEAAEDVTQSVFLKVYSGLGRFHRDGKKHRFRFWISRIVQNEIATVLRRAYRHEQPRGGSGFQQYLENQPEDVDDESLDWCHPTRILARACDLVKPRVKPQNWKAFELVKQGFSPSEAAEKLGMDPAAVRQAIFRIRRLLKIELDGMLD